MATIHTLGLISTFQDQGALHIRGAVVEEFDHLRTMLSGLPHHRAGIRLTGIDDLRPFFAPTGAIGSLAAGVMGHHAKPVRAVLFDKTATTNWALGWHQDRTICVRARVDVPGFGPWTVKQGLVHVAPPFGVIARLITLRVHLDDVPETKLHCSWRSARIARDALPPEPSTGSCAAPSSCRAWPLRATYGYIGHRSCTHPSPQSSRRDAGCCKSIIPPIPCPRNWNGLASRRQWEGTNRESIHRPMRPTAM